MKRWMLLLLIIAFIGCDLDDDDYDGHEHFNHVLLLQIDYNTLEFEGGIEMGLHSPLNESTEIPITVDYKAPGDFGYLKLYYQPLDEKIFAGTIVWAGKGERLFPRLAHEKYFSRLEESIDFPGDGKFQVIFPTEGTEFDYENLWNAVANIKFVEKYLQSGKNIGVFLYQRSVGVGDPSDWDWYIVMNR